MAGWSAPSSSNPHLVASLNQHNEAPFTTQDAYQLYANQVVRQPNGGRELDGSKLDYWDRMSVRNIFSAAAKFKVVVSGFVLTHPSRGIYQWKEVHHANNTSGGKNPSNP